MTANLVIIQLLHTQSNHADFLRLCWDNLNQSQKKEIFYFLYNAGQYKTFLTILRIELNTSEPFIPWTHLFAILEKKSKLDPQLVHAFMNSQNAEELGLFRLKDPSLFERWQSRRKDAVTLHEEKKEQLLRSLAFAKQQGIREQRNKILDELKGLYPNDKKILAAIHTEKEFQARNTLSKISARRQQLMPTSASSGLKVDKKFVSKILKAAMGNIKKNKDLALDFAIMFFQAELYNEALKIIDTVKSKSVNLLWHELQISIEAQQFARALSVIQVLKKKKEINGDRSFSLLYFEALALYGLGQETKALQIVKNIVRIRPHFKSASSLLLEWETDK